MNFFKRSKKPPQQNKDEKPSSDIHNNDSPLLSIEGIKQHVESHFLHSEDVKTTSFKYQEKKGMVYYFETMIDKEKLEQRFLIPIIKEEHQPDLTQSTFSYLSTTTSFTDMTTKMLNGFAIIYIEGDQQVYVMDVALNNVRSTDEPQSEKVIRGSHQGFVENLPTNLNLLRSRYEQGNLVVKYFSHKEKQNKIAIVFMNDFVDQKVVRAIEDRITTVSEKMIFGSGTIEEMIENTSMSPFPQMLNTERPDRVMSYLMEGKVAILLDGTPTALIMPITFFSFYQSPDDYNSRAYIGTFLRVLRLISFLIAITLPAIYIAVIGFHFEVMPEELVVTVKGSIDNVPYPPLIEAMLMELTIELIREAGIRLPSAIGPTISIVGGLVIGDAIVKAGLVSNTMIVIVATTAIASYVVPSNEMSSTVRLTRFPMMVAAATFGFVGIVFGLMALLIHLCKLESFGTPYFTPIAPFRWKSIKDTLIRMPIWMLKTTPSDPKEPKKKRRGNQ
ncbi:spore germination protein [Bacillus massiliigorillae]|uniref:spore germination protein n=1 Tax=Bacillus massiliigorillae TaxID=1243664 RepID=UPI0003A92D65|nr:spore germination protein [Bacillus massiliigorillae]